MSLNNALDIAALLADVRDGRTTLEFAQAQIHAALREQPFEDLGFAKVDHHRDIRQGFPEVILGLGKTPAQVAAIADEIVGRKHPLLVTRADEAAWKAVNDLIPSAEYHAIARCITLKGESMPGKGTIALCSAGTSDQPV